ncbi:MAG: adenosine deaminase [bacterium]|nr:adenosine deaminase [bacterium]
MTHATLRKLPKVELHRHLDGSVRLETIKELAKYHNLDLGVQSEEELLRKTKIKEPMNNLEEVLDVFWTTQKVLCSYDAVKRVTFENVEDAFYDGVKLLELRFAPVFIAYGKRLGFDEIIEGVLDGITEGMASYGIQVGLIHIIPRPLEPGRHEESTREFLRYRKSIHTNGHRLCGFDLADSETEVKAADFIPLVEMVRKEGVGITVHTGENTDAQYVKRAVEAYNPARIGHGIKIIDDGDVMELINEKRIHLELNPTSNWLTRSVATIEAHPLPEFYREGIPISINSDDPHMMDIDLVNEYELAERYFKLGAVDFFDINKNAVGYSFLDDDIKRDVIEKEFK